VKGNSVFTSLKAPFIAGAYFPLSEPGNAQEQDCAIIFRLDSDSDAWVWHIAPFKASLLGHLHTS